MASSKNKTTSGIKLEFVVAYKSTSSPSSVRDAIAELLSAPITGHCDLPGCELNHKHPLDLSNNRHADHAWSVFECQTVPISQEEMDAAATDDLEACLCAIAVSSPGRYSNIQNLQWWNDTGKQTDHHSWFSPESEIEYVLYQLNSINDSNRDNGLLAIYTNASCRLQVHIGSGLPTRGISLEKTKTILQFLTLFERALDSVQSDHRIRYGPMDTPAWLNALSHPRTFWRNLDEWSAIFPITSSYIDLTKLMVPRKSSVSKSGHVVANRTFEFSQHAATLNVDEILYRVNVCEAIVDCASASQPGQLQQYAWDKWYDLEYTLPQILADIGAKQETVEHYKQVLSADDSYERGIFTDAIKAIDGHQVSSLLSLAATERYLHSNRAASGLATSFKIMHDQYGWFPHGSPVAHLQPTLPIFSQEHMCTFKGAMAQLESPSKPLRSSSHASVWETSENEELEPDDSVSQVG